MTAKPRIGSKKGLEGLRRVKSGSDGESEEIDGIWEYGERFSGEWRLGTSVHWRRKDYGATLHLGLNDE